MHQGNLFVDANGKIVAVDFGIMGRLSPKERRFLAEILYGFIARDYRRAAEAHYAAGYVPTYHPVEVFAQALRAIGEPLNGRPAEEISMGHLLGQLFAYTDVFDMETRPELILLQKTMVVVEGVARHLDPTVNIWTAAEPIVKVWMEKELGLEGRLAEARQGADQLGQFASELPRLLLQAERAAGAFAGMAETGLRLEDETIRRLAAEEARQTRSGRIALWLGALALLALLAAAVL
jgi:ubiquinone biosynthesis protein